jgi:hypothetical protein
MGNGDAIFRLPFRVLVTVRFRPLDAMSSRAETIVARRILGNSPRLP